MFFALYPSQKISVTVGGYQNRLASRAETEGGVLVLGLPLLPLRTEDLRKSSAMEIYHRGSSWDGYRCELDLLDQLK